MKQIKYSYCVDESGELIHIKSLKDSTRHARQLYCLQCGQEMVANLGNIKSWHFSHKANTACDGESYLHKLAKRRIKEKFDTSSHFPITFVRDIPCSEINHCPLGEGSYCKSKEVPVESDLKLWNDKVVYDTCQEEVPYGGFRADLLLSLSSKPQRKPVFIEIYKSHKSEKEKIGSCFKIIETHQLKSEDDIDDIICHGFIEGKNCEVHNFNPRLPAIRSKISITRFVLFKDGSTHIHNALNNDVVYCDMINRRIAKDSVVELNMKNQGIDLWGTQEETNKLDSFQTGLVYLLKKGYDIKNCIRCKFYKSNEDYNKHNCIIYKFFKGLEFQRPEQTEARNCVLYKENQQLMSHSLEELEEEVSEVLDQT